VYMTIDKNLRSTLGSEWTKESKDINKKEDWKHLKETTSKVKVLLKSECSWSDDVSSEAADHQNQQFIRRCKLNDSKVVQWIHFRLSIAEEWKRGATTKFKGFESIRSMFFEERWQSTLCTNCTTTSSTKQSLSLLQDKDNSSAPATMFLHTWNEFEIDPS